MQECFPYWGFSIVDRIVVKVTDSGPRYDFVWTRIYLFVELLVFGKTTFRKDLDDTLKKEVNVYTLLLEVWEHPPHPCYSSARDHMLRIGSAKI